MKFDRNLECPRQKSQRWQLRGHLWHYRVPRKYLPRFLFWSALLFALPPIAGYLNGSQFFWFFLAFPVAFTFFLFLIYGNPDREEIVAHTKVTKYYSRRHLISIGVFWACLIAVIIWLLVRRLPG